MPAQPPSLSLLLDNDVANFNVIYDDYFDVFFVIVYFIVALVVIAVAVLLMFTGSICLINNNGRRRRRIPRPQLPNRGAHSWSKK